MYRFIIVLSTTLVLLLAGVAQAAWVDPGLEQEIAEVGQQEWVNVYVTLKDQVNLRALDAEMDAIGAGRALRHYEVITRLQDLAAESQEMFLAELRTAKQQRVINHIKPFWISNSVALTIKPSYLPQLAKHPDVLSVYLDYPIGLIEPVATGDPQPATTGKGIENGVVNTRAPELWALGIDGTGALACDQDTGADGSHPAFADRWRGLDPGVDPGHAWFDPLEHETFPTESGWNTHGTHTLGTMIGDDGGDNQIGVAPGAKWIGAKTIDTGGDIFSDAVAGFQWMADPDGNPGTIEDVPDVVNNSWGLHPGYYGSCLDDFNASIDAAEAAGVVVVFAAGNEGPGSQSLRSPGNRIASDYNVFSIAALNQDGVSAASFSSRGPSDCDGSTIKPEVSAVGVDVRSSQPGNTYATMSGTSMATPHVAGTVLLLRQAFPDATPDQIKEALYMTAVDLGDPGEDNTFGMGRIDVVEAHAYLMVTMVNSDGKVRITPERDYSCSDEIVIRVLDEDLVDPSISINVASTSSPSGMPFTLDLTDSAGVYEGTLPTATINTPGYLYVHHGDTVTATYIDADDGNGNFNVVKTAEVVTDCQPPVFAGLTGATAGDYQVELTWDPATDDNAIVYNVYRAETSGGYNWSVPHVVASASPFIDEGAQNNNTYYYVVRAVDVLGNEEDNLVELSATPFGPNRLLSEDWEAGDVFADWEIINEGCSGTWRIETAGFSPYFDNQYIIADCSDCMFGSMNEFLISPVIDTRHYMDLELRYSHDFDMDSLPMWEKAEVHYTIDGGASWVQLVRYWEDASGDEVLVMPAETENVGDLQIRFHYDANVLFGDSWGIDDIEIVAWPDGTGDDDDDDDDNDDTTDDDTTDDDTTDDDTTDDDTTDDDTTDDDTTDDDTIDDDTVERNDDEE
ncbi:MAG: S8 family serine peptidase, partial [Candidatus Lernaella stagnicola]|nr:S8 family serine peptidase [Candidatus Lernaella stagnicola]